MLKLQLIIFVLCFWCATLVQSLAIADMFVKVLNLCGRNKNVTLVTCIKEKSVIALDQVYQSKQEINIIPNFISLSKYDTAMPGTVERSSKLWSEDLASQNKSILDNLIIKKFSDFVQSRAISIKVPMTSLDFLNLLFNKIDKEEGRGSRKKDNKGGLLAIGAMMAGTMMAMKLAAIAAIAGKALMASMMAILLAAVAALSKKGSTHGSTYEVINVPTHGHHARRSVTEISPYPMIYHRVEPIQNESVEVDAN